MATEIAGQVGPQVVSDGVIATPRLGKTSEQIISELHGRFYEQNYRGKVFSDGIATVAAITASTFNISTLTASATPIIGLWNPSTSGVNAVILSATLSIIKTALQNTGCGPFFWAGSVGNTALTLGNTPFCRGTMVAGGSMCKGLSNIALTGLTNALTVKGASALFGGGSVLAAFLETQAGDSGFHVASRELFDGDWIVPPGGVLALLAGSAGVGVSASSMIVWEEVPV